MYCYDVETKALNWSNTKVTLVVYFDWIGWIHHEVVPHGQTVHKEYYTEVLSRLKETVRKKRSDL